MRIRDKTTNPPTTREIAELHKFSAGGAYLLGVNGVVVIAHGSSGRIAIANALRMARDGLARDLVGEMKRRLAQASATERQLVDERPASP